VLTGGVNARIDFEASDDRAAAESESRPAGEDGPRDLDRSRRSAETRKIRVEADRRDQEAAIRDAVSDERERVADRKAFLDPNGDYPGQGERRASALDRADSKTDRESSAEDRAQLAESANTEEPGGDGG
jgi:hypothetical protein